MLTTIRPAFLNSSAELLYKCRWQFYLLSCMTSSAVSHHWKGNMLLKFQHVCSVVFSAILFQAGFNSACQVRKISLFQTQHLSAIVADNNVFVAFCPIYPCFRITCVHNVELPEHQPCLIQPHELYCTERSWEPNRFDSDTTNVTSRVVFAFLTATREASTCCGAEPELSVWRDICTEEMSGSAEHKAWN